MRTDGCQSEFSVQRSVNNSALSTLNDAVLTAASADLKVPAVLDAARCTRIANYSCAVMSGILQLLTIPRACQYLAQINGFDNLGHKARLDPADHDKFPLARTDVIVSDDRITITELNISSRLGMLFDHDVMARSLEADSLGAAIVRSLRLSRGTVLPAVGRLLDERINNLGGGSICAAHGHNPRERLAMTYADTVRDEIRRLGYQAFAAPVSELVKGTVGLVHPAHGQIALVYRLFGDADLRSAEADQRYLSEQVRARRLAVLDGLLGEVIGTKATMVLLSDDRWLDQLPADLAAEIKECVPWTRPLSPGQTDRDGKCVDVVPYTIQNRSRLVVKPIIGSGGMWVIIGADLSQTQWESAIANVLRSNISWVIQDFAEPHTAEVVKRTSAGEITRTPRRVNYGAILVQRRCAGLIRRDGPLDHRNLNAAQGSSVSPLYWPLPPGTDEGAVDEDYQNRNVVRAADDVDRPDASIRAPRRHDGC